MRSQIYRATKYCDSSFCFGSAFNRNRNVKLNIIFLFWEITSERRVNC